MRRVISAANCCKAVVILTLSYCLGGGAAEKSACFIRQDNDSYVLGNKYIELKVVPASGGGVSSFIFKPLNTDLNQKNCISFQDVLITQRPAKKGRTSIFTESLSSMKYTAKIIADTPELVKLELSRNSGSDEFRGITLSKTYQIRRGASEAEIIYRCRNGNSSPKKAGFRSKTFFRKSNYFPEKNKFSYPGENGTVETIHPGPKIKRGGKFVLSPSSNWSAATDLNDGNGVLMLVDERYLSALFNWYSITDFTSTMEFFLRQQTIPGNGVWEAVVKIIPLSRMPGIDAVLKRDIVCGGSKDKLYLLSPVKTSVEIQIAGKSGQTVALNPSQAVPVDLNASGGEEISILADGQLAGKLVARGGKLVVAGTRSPRIGEESLLPVYYINHAKNGKAGLDLHNLASVESGKKGSGNTFTVSVLRQFQDSVAEAYISPGQVSAAEKGVEVRTSGGTPAPAVFVKSPDGSGVVLWKVAGLGAKPYRCKAKNGVLYKYGKEFGAIKEKYTVRLGTPGKAKFIGGAPKEANMIFDGRFNRTDGKNGWMDVKKYRDLISLDKSQFKSSPQSLKIVKHEKMPYTSVAFFGIVEPGQNYEISAWCCQKSQGKSELSLPVYFFDKNWDRLKDSKGRPWRRYVGSVTGSFPWLEIRNSYCAPPGARFIGVSVSCRPEKGALWLDDIVIKPQLIKSTDPIEEERAKISTTTYKPLNQLMQVSEAFVSPHVKWLRPKAGKRPEVLWLTSMRYPTDLSKRELVEISQRMSLNWRFIPLLPRMLTPVNGFLGMNSGDTYTVAFEPYIMMLLKKEIAEKKPEVIVVQKLDFGAPGKKAPDVVQKEFVDLLLEQVKTGSGLILLNCSNLPAEIKTVLGKDKVPVPETFFLYPEVRKVSRSRIASICQTAVYGKGRIACLNQQLYLYPCVPKSRIHEYDMFYDYCVRCFPFMEYLRIPLLKAIRWAAAEKPAVELKKIIRDKDFLDFQVDAAQAGNATMDLDFKNIYWQDEGREQRRVKLSKGINNVRIKLPDNIGGGRYVVHCRIMNGKNKVEDFGAALFTLPESVKVKSVEFNREKRIYGKGEEITANINLEGDLTGMELECEVEDANLRTTHRIRQPAKISKISFKPKPPYTTLNRLYVKVKKNGKTLCTRMEEFSSPFYYPPEDDMTSYIWGGFTPRLLVLKDYFDCDMTSFSKNNIVNGRYRALNNFNVRPASINCGWVLNTIKNIRRYKDDRPSTDPVRDPCLSRPERWVKIRKILHDRMRSNRDIYFGVRDYLMCDEFSLGASVCVSPYCLADFRKYLKRQYLGGLAELNKSWKTNFKSWNQVKPLSRDEISLKKDNMAAWLDHRLFMNNVYAYTWIGNTGKFMREINPKIKLGASGTMNPGYTFDWYKCMKEMEFMANYGGIQNDLVASFAKPGAMCGQWTGGYVSPILPFERYCRSIPWEQLFRRNRAYMYFMGGAGTTMTGDLQMTENMKSSMEELDEIKSGIAKLLLSSPETPVKIKMLYSQSSLFAAIATIGKGYWDGALDSWKRVLEDLKYNFHFISSEQLAKTGINPDECKVLILPCALSLSPGEVASITEFARRGGTVIADFAPGIFDGHGALYKNRKVQELFGINRKDGKLDINYCEEKITACPLFGIAAGKFPTRYAESGLKLTTGKSYGNTGTPSAPAMIVGKKGKGRILLMNNLMNGYSQIVLGGAGGELSHEVRGPREIRVMTQNLLSGILRSSGLKPFITVKTADGKVFPSIGGNFADGNKRYIGIMQPMKGPGRIDRKKDAVKVNVTFPETAYVYDVRNGKYLGKKASFNDMMVPAVAKLYAFLPYRVTGVNATGQKECRRGESISFDVDVRTEPAKAASGHVVRAELTNPAGKVVKCYSRNVKFPGSDGKLVFNTALNDMPGKWVLTVKDVISGKKSDTDFILK